MAKKRRGLPGRPSEFPGKDRDKPVQVYLTRDGLLALEAGCSHEGKSRPDYIEKLLLRAAERIPNWRVIGGRNLQLREVRVRERTAAAADR